MLESLTNCQGQILDEKNTDKRDEAEGGMYKAQYSASQNGVSFTAFHGSFGVLMQATNAPLSFTITHETKIMDYLAPTCELYARVSPEM